MVESPFDDELAEAYAALAEEATVPAANRRQLFQRALPGLGLGAVALALVGLIGSYALQARSNAAQVIPANATHQPGHVPSSTAETHHTQASSTHTPRTSEQPDAAPQRDKTAATQNPGASVPLGIHDLAVRYAFTWANRGGGLDPAARANLLAAMRGKDTPSTPTEEDNEGMQVVLNAHVADVTLRDSTHVVTVALLLAGPQAPVWSALQVAIVPSATGGWTVAGDPAWVAFSTAGKALPTTTTKLTWVAPEQSTSRDQLTTFFTKYGESALVHDPAVVAKPLGGLGGTMRFDQLEGVATDGNHETLYARVRWRSATGLAMSQVYRLHIASTGGIDSVEVAAIE